MGGKSPRKGKKEERVLVELFQEAGFAAERIPFQGGRRPGDKGGDISVPILGIDRRLESKVKAKGGGFRGLYGWLETVDIGIVRMDYEKSLAVLPLDLLLEIMKAAEKSRAPGREELPDNLPVINGAEIVGGI